MRTCFAAAFAAVAASPVLAADPFTIEEPAPREDVSVEVLVDGLTQPWGLALLPDGRMLVTERPGRLRLVDADGALAPTPVTGLPPIYVDNQAGLFDVVPHPDFADNSLLYISYAHGDKDANALRIARARFDGAALQNFEVLFEVDPLKKGGAHYGAKIAFLPDGTFMATTGEGYGYREKAQKTDNHFGKTIRLNADGSIPADNPFVGEDGLDAIYSYGHRNPQGLAYDAVRGVIFEHEHGPKGGDEINVIKAGLNYGWPLATYGVDYSGAQISPYQEYRGTTQPVLQWTPSIAPSGLAVYSGDLFAEWEGDLLVGALSYRELRRVEMEGDEPVAQYSLLKDRKERVRDVRVGEDGAIYVVSSEERKGGERGKVLRLTPAK
ncbi:MAG: PQQ-dependent sugar dehydrogenase [Pseudomonadota bacterium]